MTMVKLKTGNMPLKRKEMKIVHKLEQSMGSSFSYIFCFQKRLFLIMVNMSFLYIYILYHPEDGQGETLLLITNFQVNLVLMTYFQQLIC